LSEAYTSNTQAMVKAAPGAMKFLSKLSMLFSQELSSGKKELVHQTYAGIHDMRVNWIEVVLCEL
jgi:hypothetical protein